MFHAETPPLPLSNSVFLLQAITAMNFKQPTPIQKACIPVGLLGKDICACAATGTGENHRDLGGGRQEEDVQPGTGSGLTHQKATLLNTQI